MLLHPMNEKIIGVQLMSHDQVINACHQSSIGAPAKPCQFKAAAAARRVRRPALFLQNIPGPFPANAVIAGPFTEMVLRGDLALRVPKKIEWDGPDLKAKTRPRPHNSSISNIAKAGACDRFLHAKPGYFKTGWAGPPTRRLIQKNGFSQFS
jgi:hypothetical protein